SALSAPARAADDGVVLSTVHRVKGMEWERVAVYGVNAGIVPHRLAEDEEEERRVLHVALTRCKREVVVLADQSRPSPMLAELDGSAVRRPAGRVAAERARSAPAPASASAREAPLSGDAAAAETALRAWRLERCRRDHVSAFIVLYDRTLKVIAAKRPTTLVELSRIDGIGPTKLELYGDEILGVLSGLDA
ncbi:MAG TPA: HRDC domain-containing protein, partial [Acidimicrobiales bacterium]